MPRNRLTTQEYLDGIVSNNRTILSQAITLIESKRKEDTIIANDLLSKITQLESNSLRIGITGVPGVGKSTFIDTFGKFLTSKGKKVAVLSIDPSSQRTKGSILGDKTRMAQLSTDELAFIRPSPSGSTLGGVANKTRESLLLCEAAGYDVIIVETVGVGQSEVAAKNMVDFFLLLMLAGGGDELQGIKRGIMETADAIAINKADGDFVKAAKKAKVDYQNALHLFPPNENSWQPTVTTCSAVEKMGIDKIWETIESFERLVKGNGYFSKNRIDQNVHWFHELLNTRVLEKLLTNQKAKEQIQLKIENIEKGIEDPSTAVSEILDIIF
ncbi:MAG: methylmalonyl Co-A mutase-associated GTPase MeaB [bacterium]|nr:methylmalonyl Co-A mutase-associated GTPase MeaB [bacterium]